MSHDTWPPSGTGAHDPFAPEQINEQITLRLSPGAAPDDDTRLARGLADIYALPRGASEPVLARTRARVLAAPITYEVNAMDRPTTPAVRPPEARRHSALPPYHTGGGARGWLAAAAAAIVVALLAGLFYGLLARGPAYQPPKKQSTPTPTMPTSSAWHIVTTLTNANPILAPSDPLIAYQLVGAGNQCTGCTGSWSLEGSDDDGAHWNALTLPAVVTQPQTSADNFVQVYVNPLDPERLVVAAAGDFGALCTPGQASVTQSGGQSPLTQLAPRAGTFCAVQFYSADGGHTWRQITLPAPGILTHASLRGPNDSALRARGSALYGTVSTRLPGVSGADPGARLIESRDGGLTWQAIDGALANGGESVYDYALVPNAATIYAVTDGAETTPPYATDYELWRSDDDGAHWRQLAAPPSQDLGGLLAGTLPGSARPVLYLDVTDPRTRMGEILASVDEGQHWTPMPIPNGPAIAATPTGVLADGSVLVPLATAAVPNNGVPGLTFAAWAPGQSQVREIGTPPLVGAFVSALLAPASPAGPASLWVTYTNGANTAMTAWLPLAGA